MVQGKWLAGDTPLAVSFSPPPTPPAEDPQVEMGICARASHSFRPPICTRLLACRRREGGREGPAQVHPHWEQEAKGPW